MNQQSMSPRTRARLELGRAGEQRAVEFLQRNGFEVLDRNWRGDDGELDVVAREGDVLVGVEVKTRRTTRFGTPAEAVTPAKVARLHRLIAQWRRAHRPVGVGRGSRVDVVAILDPGDAPVTIHHMRGLT